MLMILRTLTPWTWRAFRQRPWTRPLSKKRQTPAQFIPSPSGLENRLAFGSFQIDELLKANPEGITDEELRAKTPAASPLQRQDAINGLLKRGALSLSQMGKMLVYKPRKAGAAAKLQGASPEEGLVFALVEEAG